MLPDRVNGFVNALVEEDNKASSNNALPEDAIVIVGGVRTALTKAHKGGFKNVKSDQLLAAVLQELLKRFPTVSVDDLGDLVVGTCLQPGGGQAMARMAAFEAGLPYSVPVATVNRQCASGLQSIANIAGGLSLGMYSLGMAAGVESMSSCTFEEATPIVDWSSVRESHLASQCMIPMGITSEKVARRYEISRDSQDAFAVRSHMRAAAARKAGHFNSEIVAYQGVSRDDSVRPDCNKQALAKLSPAFKKGGSTTAGNSSPLSDGACAVLVTTEGERKKRGLPALCIWLGYAVVGVPPDIMGVGPAYAIPAVLKQTGLDITDIDCFEINEAFASQILFCMKFLGLPEDKVNPCGGALALGHPLGCSGNRLLLSCANYLQRNGLRYGIISMCVGTGMGAAAVIENPAFRTVGSSRSRL